MKLKCRVSSIGVWAVLFSLASVAEANETLFSTDPMTIAKTRVTLTIVGGKIVYRAP